MKTIIRKSIVTATLLLAVTASALHTQAKSSKLVYDRSVNNTIGVTVENATGARFEIRNSKGNTVHEGKVKSSNRFYIPTSGLAKGTYQFVIGNTTLREFVIR